MNESAKKILMAKANFLSDKIKEKWGHSVDPQNVYDVLESSNQKKRRRSTIEINGEDSQMSSVQRLESLNIGRDLRRNFTAAKAHLKQFVLQAVGTGPKIIIRGDDKESKAAADWFNSDFSKDCDSRDDTPLGEQIGIILESVIRDGEILPVFDDFDRADGKIVYFESDQMAQISKSEWEKQSLWPEKKYSQSKGIVTDKKGRVEAYIVSAKRGHSEYKMEECTILPRGVAKLIKNPFRPNQQRGISDMLASAAAHGDLYEILSSQLQTSKLGSKLAGKVTRNNATEDLGLDNWIDIEAALSGTDAAADAGEKTNDNYERFESLTGGYLEYLQPGDNFELMDFDRPGVNLRDFVSYVNIMNGLSMGLFSCYSTGVVSSSYTAFRGEQIMTWPAFEYWQKLLERRFLDWLVPKAVTFAVEKKMIKAPPVGWQRGLTAKWPSMREVDPQAYANGIDSLLKNAQTDFSELLGPDWKQKIDSFAEQIEYIRGKNIPLGIFETKAGAPVTGSNAKTNTEPAPNQSFMQKLIARFTHE